MNENNQAARPGFAEDCPCTNTNCHIFGDCVACVRGHQHGTHLPQCLQPQLRKLVQALAEHVEYKVVENRHTL